jgi:CRM1 C terminal
VLSRVTPSPPACPSCRLTARPSLQVKILGSLLGTVKSGLVPVNLWPEGQSYPSNLAFVCSHLLQLLSTSFPNMTEAQVQRTVDKMFELVDDMTGFKNHCRDFLVQVRPRVACVRVCPGSRARCDVCARSAARHALALQLTRASCADEGVWQCGQQRAVRGGGGRGGGCARGRRAWAGESERHEGRGRDG